MSSVLRCGGMVRLLAVLWVMARCGTSQQQPTAVLYTSQEELSRYIEQAVKSEIQPVITKLESRMDTLDSRLQTLDSRLDTMSSTPAHRDCSDLPAGAKSGVHLLQPGPGRTVPVPAYCDLDMDGGRWTVFQRRGDFQPRRDFYLGWQAYKEGFGELVAEFWWGLEHLWEVTSSRDRRYELRIDMEDFEGEERHAVYQGFRISYEAEGYRLVAANYTGDAGDSLRSHVGQKFSTKDRDNDPDENTSCAQKFKGAWWFEGCHDSHLNGQYLSGTTTNSTGHGVIWYDWRGSQYSLKTVEMKIRPTKQAQEVK